jgi:hypothetical protein
MSLARLIGDESGTVGGDSEEAAPGLARVRDASVLPWRDLTQAYLAELRFNSIAGWVPNDEADPLRADFRRELDRLYAAVESSDEA